MTKHLVVVAGNIGAGKTSLTERIGSRLGWWTGYESVVDNPYLADFYADMRAWAFHSQIFFLTHRLRAHRMLLDHPTSAIQDRTVYEDAEVFARNLYRQGFISERDNSAYRELYLVLCEFLPPPDLVVYLRSSVTTLVKRISLRGRDYERQIAPDYLTQLNILYEDWIQHFSLCPVLTVPADDLDYVAHPGHLDLIVRKIQEKLTGKEVVVFDPEEVNSTV